MCFETDQLKCNNEHKKGIVVNCDTAGIFSIQRARSLVDSWSHDIQQTNCFPRNVHEQATFAKAGNSALRERVTVHCFP